jgi:hypothetical protein
VRARDLDLVLEADELAEEGLFLRAPPAAIEVENRRTLADEVGELPRVAGVIGELQIGKGASLCEICSHANALPSSLDPQA